MSMKSVISLLAVLVLGVGIISQFYFFKEPSPVVSTELGDIQGILMRSRSGRPFYGYFGIPFARPPVGNKRFQVTSKTARCRKSKPPEKPEKWNGNWDGSHYRPVCMQFEFMATGLTIGSEDCLYLNVFLPKIEENARRKNLPVMVHIHGGYFHMGGSNQRGPHFFMDHDVIIVTITYRVGILGFLNTGDDVVRGNMGLKDQNLALQWVQKNIKHFGGDPDRVTLFGESAGAVSVQHHMLSSKSKGLFSRAIRQSGSALNYWGLMTSETANQQAKSFAQKFNCPLDTTQNMVSCLQNIDASTIVSGHIDLMVNDTGNIEELDKCIKHWIGIQFQEHPTPLTSMFVPSIESIKHDDAFLTEDPLELIKTGRFQRVPLLSGLSVDEGLLHSTVLYANDTKLRDSINDWFNWAPKAFHYSPEQRDVSQKIFDFYVGPYSKMPENRRELLQNLTNAYGDRLFNYGIITSVKQEQKYIKDMYNYLYDHEGGVNLGALLACSEATIHPILCICWKVVQGVFWNRIIGTDLPAELPGTCHGDEVVLLWDYPLFNVFLSEKKDLQLSRDLIQLWVDFATDETPVKFQGVELPVSLGKNKSLKFIRLSTKNVDVIQDPFLERLEFWKRLGIKL